MVDILLSPFDNFFLFTIESQLNGVRVATDLSVYREAYLTFKDSDTYAVRVKSSPLFGQSSAQQGEVNFIVLSYDAQQARKIKTKNFLISVIRDYPDGTSDETVIFTGTWDLFEKSAENDYNALSVGINQTVQANTSKIASLETERASLLADIESLTSSVNSKEAEKVSLETTLNANLAKLSSLKTSGLTKEGLTPPGESQPQDVVMETGKKANVAVPTPEEGVPASEAAARRRRGFARRIIEA
jgi:hypothetical protein